MYGVTPLSITILTRESVERTIPFGIQRGALATHKLVVNMVLRRVFAPVPEWIPSCIYYRRIRRVTVHADPG